MHIIALCLMVMRICACLTDENNSSILPFPCHSLKSLYILDTQEAFYMLLEIKAQFFPSREAFCEHLVQLKPASLCPSFVT